MKIIQNRIKKIVKYGEFTQQDLNDAKELINQDAYPQFYLPYDGTVYSLPEGIEYVRTDIIDAKSITREGTIGSSQPIRSSGGNENRPELERDIIENGWKLFCTPISVISVSNRTIIGDGRTKDKILEDLKYKNRIVNIYKFVGKYENDPNLQDDAIEEFGLEGNEEPYTAGYNVQSDYYEIGKKKVARGTLQPTEPDILSWVTRKAKSFSKQKQQNIAMRIFADVNQSNGGIKVEAWRQQEADVWMKKNNYIQAGNVMYLVVSAEVASKALFSASKLAQENPGKEIRVVLHTGYLTGWDQRKSYVNKIMKFKTEWYLKLDRKSTRLNSSHIPLSRMPSSA